MVGMPLNQTKPNQTKPDWVLSMGQIELFEI